MSVDICPILRGVPTNSQASVLSKLLAVGNVCPSSLQSHASTLLPLLSSPQDQLTGLVSLLPLLRFSPSLCSTNCDKLLPHLSKIMTRPGLPLSTLKLVYQCMVLLIAGSVTSSETGKLVSSMAPSMISSILNTKSGPTRSSSLQLLVVLMSRYPGSCGQARSRLQDMLVTLLGEEVCVELLGKCFSLLPQVGGGGRDGAEHISQYTSLLSSLVSTVHTGLSSLYPHVREFDTFTSNLSVPPLTLAQGGGGQLERSITLAMQLDRAMGVLGQLLTRGFPHVRQVPVDMFLSLPTRLLSLTLPPSTTPNHQLLSSLLSQLTGSSLSLICQLVNSLQDQLLPEAGSINSLLVSGLGRVSSPKIRAGLYYLLSCWLEGAGAASGIELCAQQIISNMVVDIMPTKEKIALEKGNSNKKKRKHGKKGGGGGNGMIKSVPSTTSTSSSPLSLPTCSAALTSLELLISSVGPWLDKETHTQISRVVLSQLLSPGPPHPQPAQLLACLTTLATVSSPSLLSTAQISLPALSLLPASLSPQVRRSLLSLQAAAHPARLSLDIQDTNTARINNVLAGKDLEEENENVEDLDYCNTATQTEMVGSDNIPIVVDDTIKRIKELEDALKVAKAAEREARALVLKKDIEMSRAAINAQKRAAKDESITAAAKKSKFSEETDDTDKLGSGGYETSDHLAPFLQEAGSAETASDETSEDKLSVAEMLQDFSDKLNSNLIPSTTADSDSD